MIEDGKDTDMVFMTWCYWDNAFQDNELQKIIDMSSKKQMYQGVVNAKEMTEEYRQSRVNFHEYNEDNKWIFHRLNGVIQELNNRYYKFDLGGYDSYQYSEYHASEKGRYDFHMDLTLGDRPVERIDKFRKLSLTLLLNEPYEEFEGGEFHINTGKESKTQVVPTQKGRIIVFPSFILHRVTPVTEGIRKSLVVWVEGPRFK